MSENFKLTMSLGGDGPRKDTFSCGQSTVQSNVHMKKKFTRIAIAGSSHIARMVKDEFVHGTTITEFIGKGGAKVNDLQAWTGQLLRFMPDFLFAQLGGNDLDRKDSADHVADELIHACRSLLASMPHLTISIGSQLIRHRTRNISPDIYELKRISLNEKLEFRTEHECPRISVWRHKKIPVSCYVDDGVHLNDRGNRRFYISVRGAVMKFLS